MVAFRKVKPILALAFFFLVCTLTTVSATCTSRPTLRLYSGYSSTGTVYLRESVKVVQMTLNEKDQAGLDVDGLFGPGTEQAVKSWQRKKNLVVDGVVGSNTWASLCQTIIPQCDPPTGDDPIGPTAWCASGAGMPATRYTDQIVREAWNSGGETYLSLTLQISEDENVHPALLATHMVWESQMGLDNGCTSREKSALTGCMWYPNCSSNCGCTGSAVWTDEGQLQCTANSDKNAYAQALTGLSSGGNAYYTVCNPYCSNSDSMWKCIFCVYQGNYDSDLDGKGKYFTRDGTCTYAENFKSQFCKWVTYFDSTDSTICGDGECNGDETSVSCSSDCGSCGDGHCNTNETPDSCPQDCGVPCGDGACDASSGETCLSCPQDCGACCNINLRSASGSKVASGTLQDCDYLCGNGICDTSSGETPASCPQDCDDLCGNGICDASAGETPSSCPKDCDDLCGNGICDASSGETPASCPQDCNGLCGNGVCDANAGETPSSCPKDCDDPISCFSGRSVLEVQGQGATPMEDLKIGDSILVTNGLYSRVYGFSHRSSTIQAEYLQIYTEGMDKSPLEISKQHILYVWKGAEVEPLPAAAVHVGGTLVSAQGTNEKVKSIRTVTRQGIYAPLTATGQFVVNGVVVSNYVTMPAGFQKYLSFGTQCMLQHSALAAYRLYCGKTGCKNEQYNEEGIPKAVTIWFPVLHLTGWLLESLMHVGNAAMGNFVRNEWFNNGQEAEVKESKVRVSD